MQLFDLTGKTALVTGGSRGLGKRFAQVLSEAGARVVVAARSLDKLDILANKLGNALALEVDISNKEAVKQAFEKLESLGEKIDICVNDAGISGKTPIFETDILDSNNFEKIMQTNVLGTWYVTVAVANHMKRHGIAGSIINIGSSNGDHFPYKELAADAVSKAAVMHMAKALAIELAQYKIRINTLSPGPVQSHLYGSPYKHDWEFWKEKIPVGFLGTPEDLDGALLYLASNQASRYVTGSCITVDGGLQ